MSSHFDTFWRARLSEAITNQQVLPNSATKWESYSRMITTSIDSTKAAKVWPFFGCISGIAPSLLMEVLA
jgi:hypothetical protein